jgi:toxin ParE1/3/4
MNIKFTPEAFKDITEIDLFLSVKTKSGLDSILRSLQRSTLFIRENPKIGKPTERDDLRIHIEPKYRFVIPYLIAIEDIWILRIFHPRRAPLDLLDLIKLSDRATRMIPPPHQTD